MQALKDVLGNTRVPELRLACQGALFQIAQYGVSPALKVSALASVYRARR